MPPDSLQAVTVQALLEDLRVHGDTQAWLLLADWWSDRGDLPCQQICLALAEYQAPLVSTPMPALPVQWNAKSLTEFFTDAGRLFAVLCASDFAVRAFNRTTPSHQAGAAAAIEAARAWLCGAIDSVWSVVDTEIAELASEDVFALSIGLSTPDFGGDTGFNSAAYAWHAADTANDFPYPRCPLTATIASFVACYVAAAAGFSRESEEHWQRSRCARLVVSHERDPILRSLLEAWNLNRGVFGPLYLQRLADHHLEPLPIASNLPRERSYF